jgi:signal transduction histidine kinase
VKGGDRAATSSGGAARDADVERRWLATLQQLTGAVAHELRNALNGVAVNLEVVRSRSGRDGLPASALGSFAGSAAGQLEQVITMTDALMALARAGQEPAALGRTADQVAALVRPVLVANGGSLELAVEGEGTTRVPATATRLFVAATMEAALDAAREKGTAAKDDHAALSCRVRTASAPEHSVELRVEGRFARAPALEAGLAELARDFSVGVVPADDSITLTFPA